MNLWDRFRRGLERTREALTTVVGAALGRRTVDAATVESLEEALLAADVGPATTDRLIADARKRLGRDESLDLRGALEQAATEILASRRADFAPGPDTPWVVLLIGVNGVGKTTFAGKLASSWAREGRKVMLVAADTFRAPPPSSSRCGRAVRASRSSVRAATAPTRPRSCTTVWPRRERAAWTSSWWTRRGACTPSTTS